MLGITDYNDTNVNVCNVEEANNLYILDYEFMNNALKGKSKCKGNMKTFK